MCSCGGKKTYNTGFTSVKNNCNGLRKRLIRIKKFAYSAFKGTNDPEDKEIYDSVSSDLSNFKYCPTEQEVIIYETRYGI